MEMKKKITFAEAGRRGGRKTSDRKKQAARDNGAKGGRPKRSSMNEIIRPFAKRIAKEIVSGAIGKLMGLMPAKIVFHRTNPPAGNSGVNVGIVGA